MKTLILGCRPVVPNAQERAAELVMGKSIATPYTDSVKAICEGCAREVWVGPRQQAVLAAKRDEDLIVLTCLPCAVELVTKAQDEAGEEVSIEARSLGNIHPDDD